MIKVLTEKYGINDFKNKIILGNALQILPTIEAETFDMVFVDPPYFMGLSSKDLKRWNGTPAVGVNDAWDKFKSQQDYDDFLVTLFREVKRLMKPTASLWTIGTYHNIFITGRILQDLGFWILNDVIWAKNNPMPNWRRCRFTNATETLIWCVKDKHCKKYTFNYDYANQFGLGNVGANIWRLPICRGNERLQNGQHQKLHSTQKPEELLRRVILTSTKPGDLILDPLAGTGTTGYMAQKLGRDYTMIELDPRYVKGAEIRLRQPLIAGFFE